MSLFAGINLATIAVAEEATATTKDQKKDESVKLEKFEVTGSRIQRLDAEGPQPIVSYQAEEIKARGYTSLADFLQTLPFNSSSAASSLTSNSFTRGATSINLRGLGSSRSLVLINGRRGIPYGLTDSANRQLFNFNTIPMDAIDGVEILKDGASAIYGSDAVTGVVNIKLKKAYSGLNTSLTLGNTIGHDTFTRAANVLLGADAGKTSVLVNVNWQKQNANYMKDYDRSRSSDTSSMGAKGSNLNSVLNWPANIYLTSSQATAAGLSTGAGYYFITGGQPTSSPTVSSFSYSASSSGITNTNKYDFAKSYQLYPDSEYSSAFVYMKHDINENISAFAQLLYVDNFTDSKFTPGAISSTSVSVPSTGTTLYIPSTNPYNPFGVNITNFYYRGSFAPVRSYENEELGTGLTTGLKGSLPSDWAWESSLNIGRGTTTVAARNQIKADDLQKALLGTLSGYTGVYLNPFGSSNADLVNALLVTSSSVYKDSATSWDGQVSGPLFEMPALFNQPSAGSVGMAAGAEWRESKRDARPDTTSYVGAGGGSAYIGVRRTMSEFVEVDIPVVRKWLELQVAARHEDYSDFGKTTKPKFAFASQPLEWLKLRGSLSQSFTAPSLGQLYSTRTVGYTSSITDPLNPGTAAQQYKIVTGGNPDLQPENGKIKYFGAVIDFGTLIKPLKGLSLSVDWSEFAIKNVIVSYTSTTTIFTYFPERVIRDSSGAILYFEATPNNVAGYTWRGYDFDLKYELPNTRYGDFRFGAQATYNSYYGYSSGITGKYYNYVGTYNLPRLNGALNVGWRKGQWGAGLNGTYKGHYFNDGYTTAGWGENGIWRFDGAVSYAGFYGFDVQVGCQNILDKDPPFNGYSTVGFDDYTYGAWSMGRYVYLKLTHRF